MAAGGFQMRNVGSLPVGRAVTTADRPHRPALAWRGVAFAAAASALILLPALPAQAQKKGGKPTPLVNPPTQFIPCAATGQPLVRIPELVTQNGRLRGTILLADMVRRMDLDLGTDKCVPQFVRYFCGVNAQLPGYGGATPPEFPQCPLPAPVGQNYVDPMPGPTLRARVGDMVELTFLNQIDPLDFGDSIDRGEHGQGCDESTNPYPGKDTYPDCFHGSSTGNIHYHGTHTSPSTTADNVFIEVRPSPRERSGRNVTEPVVTEESVKAAFADFFSACEIHLRNNVLAEWPKTWNDFPSAYTSRQEELLKAYDSDPTIHSKLWPVDAKQIREGAWPQYYIGAYPFCFRLPIYSATTYPPPPPPSTGDHAMQEDRPVLQMGQSPGTHWYHAHKHGSTTINVMNGMTGVFIIEGTYDDALNGFYGQSWARQQPVLVINEYGVSPKLFGGGNNPLPFAVNGRREPQLTMRPGEVQLWRIANTSSRSGAFFTSPPRLDPSRDYDPTKDFQWKQTAQDGVQFTGPNYDRHLNRSFLLAAGNRADLLVKAPANQTGKPQVFTLQVVPAVSAGETQGQKKAVTLLTVQVESGPSDTGNQSMFIPAATLNASFPPFLADIGPGEVKATKTVVFESKDGPPYTKHTIDGKKFDGKIGQVVLLNTVEEWKIENRTLSSSGTGPIDHPFHIHINPFQVVELFRPNDTVTNKDGKVVPKYVFFNMPAPDAAQCFLDASKPETWKDCHPVTPPGIWWDVFPIPSAIGATDAQGNPITDPKTGQQIVVPGYFKMRSRFVDYAGQYVMHCHILAHEDRGMMTIVEVTPDTTAYAHK